MSQDRVALDPADGQRLGSVFGTPPPPSPSGGCTWTCAPAPASRHGAAAPISCGPVRVRAPWRPGVAPEGAEPVDCSVVRVWEPAPPEGVEPLEWDLYTHQPVAALEGAASVAMDYASRYLIEEFHKGLKTGLKAEALQLEKAPAVRGDRGDERGGAAAVGPA